jgi:hypothetical protein
VSDLGIAFCQFFLESKNENDLHNFGIEFDNGSFRICAFCQFLAGAGSFFGTIDFVCPQRPQKDTRSTTP